jgi:DNA-binding PadR family transcriptional regulator
MPALSPPVFQILLSLLDGDAHGYAIILDVRDRTDGEIDLTASTLYAALKRMLGQGWIEEVKRRTRPTDDDPRRRYYRISKMGRETARAEALRLDRLTAMARERRLLPELRPAFSRKATS